MLERQARAAIAATIATVLLIPAVGSLAGPKKKLHKVEKEQEELQDRIEADSARENSLQDRVNSLSSSMTQLQIQLNKLAAEKAEVAEQVRSAQLRIDQTQKQINKVEDLATQQAVDLYKEGGTDTIDALLDSESLAELDEKAEMLGVAAQENTDALIRYSRLRVTIQEQNQELFTLQADLQAKSDARTAVLSRLQTQRSELESSLEKLRKRLGIAEAREWKLGSAAARLRGDVVEAQARNAVAALGTSSAGFIWPLNGSVTSPYGPRWGRMHSGIDINGVTGQPIVAAKEGTVILASYYSGYGNAVIVDHGGGYATLYAHMSEFSTTNGASVSQGDLIGYVGCTGNCYGDHLHFEVQINGNAVDPMLYLP